MGKRVFDLVCAGLGLVVLSPLLVFGAILVKLSGPGPVLFRQQRVGRGFVPFTMYKFRTMHNAAPQGPLLTVQGDPRVTPAGRFLRRSKLDELPQLFNVLRGDMSLVGPRPEVSQFVELFRDDYAEILTVRPGMTDEASIIYRDEEAILAAATDPHETYFREVLPRKLELAKRYARNHSTLGDAVIILKTLALL